MDAYGEENGKTKKAVRWLRSGFRQKSVSAGVRGFSITETALLPRKKKTGPKILKPGSPARTGGTGDLTMPGRPSEKRTTAGESQIR